MRRSQGSVAVAALVMLAAMTGCTSASAGADEATATPEPTDAAAQVVTIPMPEFAPWPAGDPFTEADVEAARLAEADRGWQTVLATYPDAVRPEVAFEAYVTDENRVDVTRACFEAAGLPIDEGRTGPDPDGPVVSIGTSTTTVEEAIALYSCRVAHPEKRTSAPPNAEQLGWIYDYLTEYYGPCLAENAIDVAPAPPRDEFVAKWPEQGWFPSNDRAMYDPEWDAALEEACVDPDTAIMTGLVDREDG
ncbi:hypothetical protein [Agromyces cerinus]|uniref:Uncharacterized protein n=1 Tax=Agromyces cerinus subsp. cerinus TaxID=232089 RepID=A0A1N6EW65_9MICO|nr:hypothetical protein [Agromyces cerinus]SIN87183.1 hypothetical protein SAMN05443544_1513 [Agromyces cerinus subsp. cerinus]